MIHTGNNLYIFVGTGHYNCQKNVQINEMHLRNLVYTLSIYLSGSAKW